MNAVTEGGLLPAWNDGVHDAQATFRGILKALSEPGAIQDLPVDVAAPVPLLPATTALCLSLADFETPLWLSEDARTPAVESYLRFHCGSPLVSDAALAHFAVIGNPLAGMSLERFAQGSMDYPDRSTTVFIQVRTLTDGPARTLSGPGIAQRHTLRVGGLPQDFDAHWRANQAGFPLGVDLVFCCGNAIVGLPRTTLIHS